MLKVHYSLSSVYIMFISIFLFFSNVYNLQMVKFEDPYPYTLNEDVEGFPINEVSWW